MRGLKPNILILVSELWQWAEWVASGHQYPQQAIFVDNLWQPSLWAISEWVRVHYYPNLYNCRHNSEKKLSVSHRQPRQASHEPPCRWFLASLERERGGQLCVNSDTLCGDLTSWWVKIVCRHYERDRRQLRSTNGHYSHLHRWTGRNASHWTCRRTPRRRSPARSRPWCRRSRCPSSAGRRHWAG